MISESLEKMLNPRSVAVIGASETPGKASERRIRSLIEGGYTGDMYLINPKRSKLFGRKAYANITDVGGEIDLVMVIVPPGFVVSAVADSIKMGAKSIIIITAGLGESGEAGKKIEAEILSEATKTGTCIVGPNCSGIFSASSRLNFLGLPRLQKGPISVLAQSGNVIDSLTYYARTRNLGFSKIISLGNAIGTGLPEYVDYFKNDRDTKVIIIYLEGIKDGNRLVNSVRETVQSKPVIVLKVGKSVAGARAAASHTGSLAGNDLIVDAAFRQAGIVRVSHIDELFDMAEVFCNCNLPKGNRVAILSEGGGDNSIAADNAEVQGLRVPVLSRETQKKIKPFLLEGMPANNPIDYGGTAEENPHMITECAKVCMESDEVDAIYITGFFGGFKDIIADHVAELEEQTATDLVALVDKFKKPIFVHTSFAREDIKSLDILKQAGIPVMESSQRSMQCLGALMRFATNRKKISQIKVFDPQSTENQVLQELFVKVRSENRVNLFEMESREILQKYELPLPESIFISQVGEVGGAVRKIPFPMAMKVVCSDIIHKSDAGGIKLNLQDEKEARQAFEEIIANACKITTRDRVLGTLISSMAAPGQECILGMIRDPQFGPVIMFGLGGIFVEVLKDVSFRIAPLASEDIEEMIQEIKGYPVLKGVRGEKPSDIDAIKVILSKLSEIALDNPQIKEIDLNPVIVHETGVSIVDSRMILEEG